MASAISSEALAGRRLMIGTPMYEGLCHGAYAATLVELALRLRALGLAFRLSFIVNQSSPERARAIIVDEFLRSDCTHLLFLDADVAARAEDIVTLLALQGENTPYAVIGGSYPRKSIDWDAVAAAADKGLGDLARHSGDIPVNLGNYPNGIALDRPVEAASIAGGYVMVRRGTYEALISAFPDLAFAPDPRERAGHGLSETLYNFYAPEIDPATRALRSEDFAFCDRVRRAGLAVWLCPWIHADHIGNFRFPGTLVDALKLQTTST